MEIIIEKSFDRLNFYKKEWDRLAKQNSTNSVFQTYEWNQCWWGVFKEDSELFVMLVKEGDHLLGIAPLMLVNKKEIYGQKRIVQFIGTSISDYCDFLIKNSRPEILTRMLEYLFCNNIQWDHLNLIGIPERSIASKAIKETLKKFNNKTFLLKYTDCPALIINNNQEAAKVISNKKSLLRRLRHFNKRGQYEVLHLFDHAEIGKYLKEFFDQHILRWKNSRTPSLFLEEKNRIFYEELTRKICIHRWLIFSVIKSKGVPIAFHFGFDHNNIIMWYKPTFNPSFSKYSPGQVLLKELLDYAIFGGKEELDFTIGQEPFKKRFSNTVRRNLSFFIYQKSIDYEMKKTYDSLCRFGSNLFRKIRTLDNGWGKYR